MKRSVRPYTSDVSAVEPKAGAEFVPASALFSRPSQLQSLAAGLALGTLGALPACLPGCDTFALLCWISMLAPAAGALLGAARIDPLRFGAVPPALWAVALALLSAGETRASLPTPAFGALAWTGLYFIGVGVGILGRRAALHAAGLLLAAALLVGLPGRGGITGAPWPARGASVLLDLSPFVFLGECCGVRDMAWHRSMYAPVGTDRFQRAAWSAPWAATGCLALGLTFALLANRRRPVRFETA